MCLKIDLKLFKLYFNILNFFNFKIRLLTFIFMSSHLQKKKARIKWSCKTRMQPSNVNLLQFKKKIKLKNLSFCKSLLNIQETLIYIFHRGWNHNCKFWRRKNKIWNLLIWGTRSEVTDIHYLALGDPFQR